MSIVIENHKCVDHKDYVSLDTILNIDSEISYLTLQVTKEYGRYLNYETCDNIIYLLLPMALKYNKNIISKVPISEHFLHNLTEIYIPTVTIGSPKLFPIKIIADTVNLAYSPFAVGTAVTCGIDSTYTIMKYQDAKAFSLTHLLLCSASVDLRYDDQYDVTNWSNINLPYFKRAIAISETTHLPLVQVYSNYLNFLCEHKYGVDHLNCHHYISLAHVLALKKMLKVYYFSGETAFTNFSLENIFDVHTSNHELLCNLVLTHDKFYCHNTGIEIVGRINKSITVMNIDSTLKQYLHPCFKKTEYNCSKPTCKKCLHMLCTLDYYNLLDKAKGIYDIDKYKINKHKYLQKLKELKDLEFLTPIYKLMLKKYPGQMK